MFKRSKIDKFYCAIDGNEQYRDATLDDLFPILTALVTDLEAEFRGRSRPDTYPGFAKREAHLNMVSKIITLTLHISSISQIPIVDIDRRVDRIVEQSGHPVSGWM